jgi:hypothetical protein
MNRIKEIFLCVVLFLLGLSIGYFGAGFIIGVLLRRNEKVL